MQEHLKGTLGERVRDLRRERNMSQQELGNVFGIDKGTIVTTDADTFWAAPVKMSL